MRQHAFVNFLHARESCKMKYPQQAELIARVREATGLSLDEIAEKVDVQPDSLKKYAGGGQPAGRNLLKLLEALLVKAPVLTGREADHFREEQPPTYGSGRGGEEPSAPLARLENILRHGSLDEVRLVRSTIDAVWRQISSRHEPPQIVRRRNGHQLMALLGAIPAGMPQDAIEQTDEMVSVPRTLARKGDYALRVRGDSMIGKGLNDGDIIIMSLSREASNGSVIAALYDEDEVTLKTYVSKNGKVYLHAENPDYPAEMIPTRELRVQGVMVGKLP